MSEKKIDYNGNKNEKKNQQKRYKTYKVFPLHYHLFYACLSISSRDKMTDYLVQEYLKESPVNLPRFTKLTLLEHMISEIKNMSILKLKSQNQDRLEKLIKWVNDNGLILGDKRVHFQTYISTDTHEEIAKMSGVTDTLGEVIELGIENYINTASEFHFSMINLAFRYNFDEVNNEK